MNIITILEEVYPGSSWSLSGEPTNELEYEESITWTSEQPKPTWQELESHWESANYSKEYKRVSEQRRLAYMIESDPIFFQVQRGDSSYTNQDWLDKIEEINARYQYPEVLGGV